MAQNLTLNIIYASFQKIDAAREFKIYLTEYSNSRFTAVEWRLVIKNKKKHLTSKSSYNFQTVHPLNGGPWPGLD